MRLRDLLAAPRRPLYALGEKLSEIDIVQIRIRLVLPGVAQHGHVDFAFAVMANPIHGFTLVRNLRNSVGQNRQALRWAMLTVRELF